MATSINISRNSDGSVNATEPGSTFVDTQPGEETGVKVHTHTKARAGGEQLRAIFGDDDEPTIETSRVTKYDSRQAIAEAREATPGMAGTALNYAGRPVPLTPDVNPRTTTVEVNGMRTSLQSAVAMGAMTRDASGAYVPNNAYQPEAPEAQTDGPAMPLLPDSVEYIQSVLAPFPQLAMQEAIVNMAQGHELGDNFTRMAQAAGVDPKEAHQAAEGVLHHLAAGLSHYLGVPVDQGVMALEVLAQIHPEESRTVLRYALGGDLTPATKLVQRAMSQHVEVTGADAKRAGYEIVSGPHGEERVKLPDGTVTSLRAAQKAGLL